MKDFYLTASEYPVFDKLRVCHPIKIVAALNTPVIAVAQCDPPWTTSEVPPEFEFEAGCEDFVLVTPRLAGFDLAFDLENGRMVPVFIMLPLRLPRTYGLVIDEHDAEALYWGEAYPGGKRPNRFV